MTIGGPDPAAHQTIPAVALGIAAHARALAQAQGMIQTAADGGRLVAEGVVELMSAQDRALGEILRQVCPDGVAGVWGMWNAL